MYNTYNMGIGMVIAVDPADKDKALALLAEAGETAYVIGETVEGETGCDIMLRVAVLVSGGGTNLQAIIDAVLKTER